MCDVNKFCESCGDIFIGSTNICPNCQQIILSDIPAHRFGLALFSLMDCCRHMNDNNLSRQELMARKKLLSLVKEMGNVSITS